MIAEFQAGWLQGADEARAAAERSEQHDARAARTAARRRARRRQLSRAGYDLSRRLGSAVGELVVRVGRGARLRSGTGTALRADGCVRRRSSRATARSSRARTSPPMPRSSGRRRLFPSLRLPTPTSALSPTRPWPCSEIVRARRLACDLIDLRYTDDRDAAALSRDRSAASRFRTPSQRACCPRCSANFRRCDAHGTLVASLARVRAGLTRRSRRDAAARRRWELRIRRRDQSERRPARRSVRCTARLGRETVNGRRDSACRRTRPTRAGSRANRRRFVRTTCLHRDAADAAAWQRTPGSAQAFAAPLFTDGASDVYMQNDRVRIAFAPDAGARIALLEGGTGGQCRDVRSVCCATPSIRRRRLRRAITSPRTRIRLPAGTFNRAYDCQRSASAAGSASVQLFLRPRRTFRRAARDSRACSRSRRVVTR